MAAKKAAKPAKPMTKTEILTALAESTDLSKKDVDNVLDELGTLIGKGLGKRGPGVFNLPGLMKVKVIRKPARISVLVIGLAGFAAFFAAIGIPFNLWSVNGKRKIIERTGECQWA